MNDIPDQHNDSLPSCDPSLSRGEFLAILVNKALLAGTIASAPMIIDSFAKPAQAASLSGTTPTPTPAPTPAPTPGPTPTPTAPPPTR